MYSSKKDFPIEVPTESIYGTVNFSSKCAICFVFSKGHEITIAALKKLCSY
jgi:hypothetical protein